MGTNPTYTEKQILKGLRTHMLDNKLSKYSFHNPMTWQGVLKRMAKCEVFANKVKSIESEHLAIWEKMGLDALESGDEKFNVPLFKMYAGAKKSFQTYELNEIEQRLINLEEKKQ